MTCPEVKQTTKVSSEDTIKEENHARRIKQNRPVLLNLELSCLVDHFHGPELSTWLNITIQPRRF